MYDIVVKVKFYFIFLIFIFQYITIFSQEKNTVISPCEKCKRDIIKADKRVLKMFNDLPCSEDIPGPIVIHKISVSHKGPLKKNEFLNGVFLNNLEPNTYKYKRIFKRKKYLNSQKSIVCDSLGKIIATGNDMLSMSCVVYNDTITTYYYQDLIDLVVEKDIKCVFNISMTQYGVVFGVSDISIWVSVLRPTGWEFYSLKEFVECCWDDFVKIKNRQKELGLE